MPCLDKFIAVKRDNGGFITMVSLHDTLNGMVCLSLCLFKALKEVPWSN